MAKKIGRAFLVLPLVGFAAVGAEAQQPRVGIEAGIAGAENQRPGASLGASLFLPLTDLLRVSAQYGQWSACDAGVGCESRGYGNQGLNLMAQFRIVGNALMSGSLGAGIGWYERYRMPEEGEPDRSWEQAMTFGGELRRAVAYNSDVYLTAGVSFPNDDYVPRWGFLRLGVDVTPF